MTEREFGIESERGRLRRALSRLRAIVGIAIAQLRHTPMQTALSVIGIALAVLAVTLLASAGIGVLETGEERFEEADRDLWITGGAVEVTPQGGLENPIVDAHDVADSVEDREDVESAAPLAFHGVYVESGEDVELITAVGLPGTHADLELEDGDPLTYGDPHYAGGSYDGPRTDELVVDRSTADALELDVGDTATVATSPDDDGREVTVVGISSTYSQFLGTPTVAMPLSELQQVAGTTGSDRATFITLALTDDADAATVQAEVQSEYPGYEVQTNREQFETMLESQVLLLASAATLVALAVLVGGVLLLNVLVLSVVQRSAQLTTLHLTGVSQRILIGIVVCQGLMIGIGGGIIGLAATPLLATIVNEIGRQVVGFSELVRLTTETIALGAAVAIVLAFIGSVLVGWFVAPTVSRLEQAQ